MYRIRRVAFIIFGSLLTVGLCAGLFAYLSTDRERNLIRDRYRQMRAALSSNDTNAATALVAPQNRGAINRQWSLLDSFAQPLGLHSSIMVFGDTATVCPQRVWHYAILPGGHTIDMIRVEGEWFFTGGVHID